MPTKSKTKKKVRRLRPRYFFEYLPPKEQAMVLTFMGVAFTSRDTDEIRDVITELLGRVHKLGWERGQRALKRKLALASR